MSDLPEIVPSVIFKTRDNVFGQWKDVTSYELFGNKRVILFALPGAFTPTCSEKQLPGFESNYKAFMDLGIDEVYCLSVNDAFVMNAWERDQQINNVKMIPDGSGSFTSQMNMLVSKEDLGFGIRSWRYAIIVDNGKIEKWFVETNMEHNGLEDPYIESTPENVLLYLLTK